MALSDNLFDYWPLISNSLVGAVNGRILTAAGDIAFESGAPGPCWLTSGGSGYLHCLAALDAPLTIAVQVYSRSTGQQITAALTKSGNDNHFMLWRETGVEFKVRARSGGVAGDATQGNLTNDVFNNAAGVFTSSTSRQAYNGGTLSAANTTSVTPTGAANRLALGSFFDGTTSHGGSAAGYRFKHFAVWSRALSDAELDSFFADPSQLLAPPGATASGVTLTAAGSLIAGTASASSGATANGVTLAAAASLLYAGGTLRFQAPGMEFGRRTGLAINTFALDAAANYRYTVHADGLVLGSALITSGVVATDSGGRLPNLVNTLIAPGVFYRVVAIRQADGEASPAFRMRSQA